MISMGKTQGTLHVRVLMPLPTLLIVIQLTALLMKPINTLIQVCGDI